DRRALARARSGMERPQGTGTKVPVAIHATAPRPTLAEKGPRHRGPGRSAAIPPGACDTGVDRPWVHAAPCAGGPGDRLLAADAVSGPHRRRGAVVPDQPAPGPHLEH